MKKNNGMMIVLSAPSGSGKGTVIKILTDGGEYALSISVTTRAPRPNEIDGRDYFFSTKQEFEELIKNGDLLEYTEYNGYYYGTPKKYVEEQIAAGKIVILEIEVDGALQVKKRFTESVLIFMTPPDKKELERRLTLRKTQTNVSIRERLEIADREIEKIDSYDYYVVNDIVEEAVKKIETIVAAERLRPFRNKHAIENFSK